MESFDELLQKAIREAVNPLISRIEELEIQLKKKGDYADWVRMPEAEKILGISDSQVTRLIHAGTIKSARKIGRLWYFDRRELRKLEASPEKLDLSKLENYSPARI